MSQNQGTHEVYRMKIVKEGFLFEIREALYRRILNQVTNEEYLALLSEIPKTMSADVVTLYINLPFVDFSKGADGGTDWEGLARNARQLEVLFNLAECIFPEDAHNADTHCLSNDVQLMTIRTAYRAGARFHACGLSVTFSDRAYELLCEQYKVATVIPLCEELSIRFFVGLSARNKKDFDRQIKEYRRHGGGGPFGVRGMVREQGAPSFSVPGDCACLGANPDDFKYSKDLHSHNLDSPLQQMSMLAALVTFWNEVLIPLHEAKK